MSAPPTFIGDMISNLMYKVQSDPGVANVGKGIGIIYDLADNVPPTLAQNMPHYTAAPIQAQQQAPPPIPAMTPGSMPTPGG